VGLLDTYVTDTGVAATAFSIRDAMGLWAIDMAKTLCKGCRGMRYGGWTVFSRDYANTADDDSDPCLFSLGSSILKTTAVCTMTANWARQE
jgi:hypothetical protein